MRLTLTPWTAAAIMAAVVVSESEAQQATYRPGMFACVRLREVLESNLTVETAGRMSSATSGREGDLLITATAGNAAALSIVAWYDSLRIWRVAAGSRMEPDASGMLGGQYRGNLTPDGSFTTRDRPFVPDEVHEVMDMSNALDDFLPRLPPRVLQVGEEWRSGDTLAVQRLSDSASGQRYRIRIERHGIVPPPAGDTLTPAYTRDLVDVGVAVWDLARGPLRYDHRIEVVAEIPASGGVKRPVRSQLQQHAIFERREDPDAAACAAGRAR